MVSSRPGAAARGGDTEPGLREGGASAGLNPLLGLPAGPQNSVNLGHSSSGVLAAFFRPVATFFAPAWAGRPKSHLKGGGWKELEERPPAEGAGQDSHSVPKTPQVLHTHRRTHTAFGSMKSYVL